MSKLTFEEIRERGLLLFEYVRGSKLYHTDTPESDTDTGGVFICPQDFDFDITEEVSDEKNDTKWWELGKFMRLAMTSNPAVIEAFFVPDELVLFEHPLFKEIRRHRDEFVTKAAFMPFGGYAVSQIKKAQGQNKKIHWEMEDMKRMTPLDFCYTFDGRQGSVNIQEWLGRYDLRQDCCGLVNLINMKDCYLMYYDFAQHFRLAGTTLDEEMQAKSRFFRFMRRHFEKQFDERVGKALEEKHEIYARRNSGKITEEELVDALCKVDLRYPEVSIIIDGETYTIVDYMREKTSTPYGEHCGIINQDGTSNTVRLCSTNKDETPVCMMTYNSEGYGSHCKKFREYEEWKSKRNKARYESNLEGEKSGDPDMKYDCKNMYHSFRNVAMCTEIAKGEGLILDRTGRDRDFLMDVRNRKFGYSELIKKLDEMTAEMQKACAESTIRESIDEGFVRNLVSDTRMKFFERKHETHKTGPTRPPMEEMNERTCRSLLQTTAQFTDMMRLDRKDVMITGSIALFKHGMLPPEREIHDVDIVIRGNEELDRDLQTITKIHGGNTFYRISDDTFKGVKHKPFIFRWKDVEFNIWVLDENVEFDTEISLVEGFRLATVKHILDAKKTYGRDKDLKDLSEICRDILNPKKVRTGERMKRNEEEPLWPVSDYR